MNDAGTRFFLPGFASGLLLVVAPVTAAPPAALGFPVDLQQVQRSQQAWADEVRSPVEIVNSVGMRLRLVPPGTFRMGSPPDEPGRGPDEWRRNVHIRRPFFIGCCEVTQQQYAQVTGRTPSLFRPGGAWADRVAGIDTSELPVDSVNWFDAVAFCRLLSRQEQAEYPGRRYRLPTEAEWEYCCRAGSATLFPAGKDQDGIRQYANFRHREAPGRPRPVASLAANPLGLHDLCGNLWEWCHDWYGDREPHRKRYVDPRGPLRGTTRVIRGGGYGSGPARLRSAERTADPPPVGDPDTGFRVVLEISRPG
ncbi:MAG: formylglycine-generating enzyme family protein [Planctomycetota bacterium]|nr:formylglycine-generating enzyme family protein [Planctomycetota bacterium]